MNVVKKDMEERENSLRILMDHILLLSEQRNKIEIIIILKSSFYVALYNNVEATVYAILEKIHDEISSYNYLELSTEIQEMMIDYGVGKEKKTVDRNNIRILYSKENKKFLQFGDFIKRKTVFSGNLDARKIRAICKNYGMKPVIFTKLADKIVVVKNKRNKISHGELSLLDAGKGITNSELEKTFLSIKCSMEELINQCNDFLVEKTYLK